MTNRPANPGFPAAIEAELPAPVRLALGYSPVRARALWIGFFGLDRRFAQLVAGSREPMLAQMRLAWWRETLQTPCQSWPEGDPLFDGLSCWQAERTSLAALADGWEALVGEAPLEPAAFAALAMARAAAIAALVRLAGCTGAEDAARDLGYRWALADICGNLSDPSERRAARALLQAARESEAKAPRVLRPVAVLCALQERALAENRPIGGMTDWLCAVRVGLLGR